MYRFEAEGRKSEATLNIQGQANNILHGWVSTDCHSPLSSSSTDPPKIDEAAFGEFRKPIIIKAGENAKWKLPFSGGGPMNIQWFKDDDELLPGLNVKIETSDTESRLNLTKCQRKDCGEVKIKIKNEFGTIEAISKLIVLGELNAGEWTLHRIISYIFVKN